MKLKYVHQEALKEDVSEAYKIWTKLKVYKKNSVLFEAPSSNGRAFSTWDTGDVEAGGGNATRKAIRAEFFFLLFRT